MKRGQKYLFNISTGLTISESRTTEARDWSWRDIVVQIMAVGAQKVYFRITFQSLWWGNHLGI
jgi:hypothetical protein